MLVPCVSHHWRKGSEEHLDTINHGRYRLANLSPESGCKNKEFYGEKGKVSKSMVYQGNFDENNPKAPYWPYGEVKLHCVSEWTSEHDSIEYYPPPCMEPSRT